MHSCNDGNEEPAGDTAILEHSAVRIAVFTHDTFGLGHVRRCMRIMGAVAERLPRSAILFLTGSPALEVCRKLPANVDCVKIPTIAKTGSKGFQPPHLPIAPAEIVLLRRHLIRETISAFAPDVFLVDNFPLGAQAELLPVLHELRRLPCTTVLGLRDIVNAPEVIRKEWTRQGIYEVLDRYYDRILVYGSRDVLDLAEAYELPPAIAAKIHYCGYVTDLAPVSRSAVEVRNTLGITGRFLLATGGGGGDGFPLLETFVRAAPRVPDASALVVTGPLMSAAHKARLRREANGHRLLVEEYEEDLRSSLAAADVVVAMCGYNTAAEITALGARAIVVPRTWKYGEHMRKETAGAEWEQLMRARALARQGLVRLIEPEALTPERLAEEIESVLSQPRATAAPGMNLQGLSAVTGHLLEIVRRRVEGRNGAR